MLEAMRQLALDFLFKELANGVLDDDLEKWFQNLRRCHPEKLFQYLIEQNKLDRAYVISPSETFGEARLEIYDVSPDNRHRLPWAQIKGPNSGDFGPVLKRNIDRGPNQAAQKSTVKRMNDAASDNKAWSGYFADIIAILQRPRLTLPDGTKIETGCGKQFSDVLSAAIELIPEDRKPVFLAVADYQGRWPGDVKEYIQYLLYASRRKYCPDKAPAVGEGFCSLCLEYRIELFPNGLAGAGINFGNVDRGGAFPGLDLANAWKGFALCGDCADLLYIYKYHVLNQDPVSKKRPFMARVAGDKALIIPYSNANSHGRQELLTAVQDFVRNIPTDVEEDETTLLDVLKDQKALLNMTFLWADVGQVIEGVYGILTDVPPSKLAELSRQNDLAHQWTHEIFPDLFLTQLRPTLSLSALRDLFKQPGGKKSRHANDSRRLFHLRREIAASVYRGEPLPEKRFWEEVMTTARWYWLDAIEEGSSYGLLNEGLGKKGPFLTAAGWIRHLAWWLYYFRRLGVMGMPDRAFEPTLEELKPYFGLESGIDSQQKAFAFLLGVLYGKVLQVQGARGVNVGANALTWLRRLTLKGSDLPQLYVKIREKLMAYETEKSPKVRALIEEIGTLGIRLGESLDLDDTTTCYYLLLGQSLSNRILKRDEHQGRDGGNNA